MRSILSPAFTGSKMRGMFLLMQESAKQFIDHFAKRLQSEKSIESEMKITFTKFTVDVIANCVFGVQCDSLGNPDNEFYTKARDISNFNTTSKFINVIAYALFPKLSKWLGLEITSRSSGEYFRNIIAETIENREKEGTIRMDMLNLLMDARKGKLQHEEITEEEDTGFAAVSEAEGEKDNVKKGK